MEAAIRLCNFSPTSYSGNMASQFSKDGKYFACLSTDGKLKIWDTVSNSFDQEFTPDFHLTSPCTCLHFIQSDPTANKGASPRKKKRKDSESNYYPNIALGTTSGQLIVYSISKANVECTINGNTNQSINCLSTVDHATVYSGSDQSILVWSLHKRKLLDKWKGGNEKITAILAIPNSDKILTASKNIKMWDVQLKEVLRTFTGHSSDVTFLHYVSPKGKEDAYFITGSKGDRLLNCWNLSDSTSNKNSVASFLMDDTVHTVCIVVANDGSTKMAATIRSGAVHIYQHTLNGKCNKPLKPKTTVQVVSDAGQSKELVKPIRIVGALFRDDETLCVGHGTEVALTFENISVSYHKKVHCLIRKDLRVSKTSKDDQSSKIQTPIISNDVHYLSSHPISVAKTSKRRNDGQMEVPMEKRLENLTINKLDGLQVPKVDNVAQLLMQGLHSKDKSILRTVLCKRDENVIRNTVKRLPIQMLIPLIQELATYVQGKTLSSQIGAIWLKHILQVHAGILISNPELPDLLGSMLGSIESRLTLLTPLNKLKGRLDLLVSQVSRNSTQDTGENEEQALLVFNDKDSSDSDEEDIELENNSESENEWEEDSSDEEPVEENDENTDLESESMSS
ncbi:hypothetical protein NQ318_022091 [Aromia moschata]|uniref:Small-subunit processome Utp12 domain-containing protein n=1 Tax=Aromia moschata TaxID=1265417 RepID=A0AAV8Z7M2_9CUCU|nr:hypothetical protein NQ318_022091 [Aromia moschata]